MMKLKVNQLRTGVYLSYINLALGSLIPFLYTPIMLKLLGQEEYGLYSLANSVVGYLSLLSFGFGSTIIRYVTKYRIEGNKHEVEKLYGFFLKLYSILGFLVIVGGVIISKNVSTIFEQGLTLAEIDKLKVLVLIMAVNVAISFPLSVFSSLAISYERFLHRKLMDIASTVAAPIVNLIVLMLGYASVGIALGTTVIQCVLGVISILYCTSILKIKPSFEKLNKNIIKEMINVSFFHFIGAIVDMLFWATDKVILGMLASTVAVAVYNVGGTFNNIVMSLTSSISGVLAPKITGMVVSDTPKKEWTMLFIKIGRLQFFIVALIVSGFTVFGQVFIDLWAGNEYANSYWIAILTLFPLCIPLIQSTGLSFVTAQNKHRFRSIVYLVIAIINVVSTYIVTPYWGGIGAAMCSCISYFVGQGLIMNIYYYKVTGLNIPLFWKNILKMSIVPGIMLVIGILLKQIIFVDNWVEFFIGVALFTVIYVLLMYVFVMNDYEKDFIRKPFMKMISKIKKKDHK